MKKQILGLIAGCVFSVGALADQTNDLCAYVGDVAYQAEQAKGQGMSLASYLDNVSKVGLKYGGTEEMVRLVAKSVYDSDARKPEHAHDIMQLSCLLSYL